jgi:hypothetical protein
MNYSTPAIDHRLMTAIKDGNCVAFVGAGFSAAAGFPQWQELIRKVADPIPDSDKDGQWVKVISLLDSHRGPSNRELEMAAQLLFDALGEQVFCERLSTGLSGKDLPDAMQSRLKHLRGIPFRAIVTTNFDPLIPGEPPSAEDYRRLLRPRRPPSPWREAVTRVALGQDPLRHTSSDADSIVVQLHGQLKKPSSLVLTRSQYRHRLYADPAYLTVLRSLLATSTVLFLGYSLTDAYLNELRSELVEAFSGHSGTSEIIAWTVIEGASEVVVRYYKEHEGPGVVPYHARGEDHGEFDAILEAIFAETSPHQLRETPPAVGLHYRAYGQKRCSVVDSSWWCFHI